MIDHRIKGKADSLSGGAKNLGGLAHEGKDISESRLVGGPSA